MITKLSKILGLWLLLLPLPSYFGCQTSGTMMGTTEVGNVSKPDSSIIITILADNTFLIIVPSELIPIENNGNYIINLSFDDVLVASSLPPPDFYEAASNDYRLKVTSSDIQNISGSIKHRYDDESEHQLTAGLEISIEIIDVTSQETIIFRGTLSDEEDTNANTENIDNNNANVDNQEPEPVNVDPEYQKNSQSPDNLQPNNAN